jgi:hypothetical protein
LIFTPNNLEDKEEDIKILESHFNETPREDFDDEDGDDGEKDEEG